MSVPSLEFRASEAVIRILHFFSVQLTKFQGVPHIDDLGLIFLQAIKTMYPQDGGRTWLIQKFTPLVESQLRLILTEMRHPKVYEHLLEGKGGAVKEPAQKKPKKDEDSTPQETLSLTVSMGPKRAPRPTMFVDDVASMITAAHEHAKSLGLTELSPESDKLARDARAPRQQTVIRQSSVVAVIPSHRASY